MKYFVYILFSASTDKHYIGQTNNLENRLKRHNSGTEKFTKTGTPWISQQNQESPFEIVGKKKASNLIASF